MGKVVRLSCLRISALTLFLITAAVTNIHCANNESPQKSEKKDHIFEAQIEPAESKTIVIQCSEEKFQKPFNEFVAKGIKVKAETISMPGGPRWFALPTDVPEWMLPMKRAYIEVLKRASPEKIILITHSDCLINDIVAAWKNQKFTKEEEIEQAKNASTFLREWFPATKIDIYYAEVDGSTVGFTAVE